MSAPRSATNGALVDKPTLAPRSAGSRVTHRCVSISPNHVMAAVPAAQPLSVAAAPMPGLAHGQAQQAAMTAAELRDRLALGARLLQAMHVELQRANESMARLETSRRELQQAEDRVHWRCQALDAALAEALRRVESAPAGAVDAAATPSHG